MAATVVPDGLVKKGPLLAGDRVVWSSYHDSDRSYRVYAARPGGAAVRLLRLDGCDHINRIAGAATGSRIVVELVNGPDMAADHSCPQGRREFEVLVLQPGGGIRRLVAEPPGSDSCVPMAAGVDGDQLAVYRLNCMRRALTLTDLRTDREQRIPTPVVGLAGVALNGRWLAIAGDTSSIAPPSLTHVRLLDLRRRREIAVAPLDDWTADDSLAVDEDGNTVVSLSRTGGPEASWLPPSARAMRRIPLRRVGYNLPVAGALIATGLSNGDLVVATVRGRIVKRLANGRGRHGDAASVGFNGRRVAWMRHGRIHNERWPLR